MGAGAWAGRERTPVETGPSEAEWERLRALYEALVPYFSVDGDPSPLYTHGGDWERAFDEYAFDDGGRLERLRLKYPAYFTDGEDRSRARIEQVLYAKAGRGREYHFAWDEVANQLTLTVLARCPPTSPRSGSSPRRARRCSASPTRTRCSGPCRSPPGRSRDAPPVVWRTGPRSTEPHLLALGQPGTGTTTLLRSIALQALQHGDVLVIDGSGTGEYGCLAGRQRRAGGGERAVGGAGDAGVGVARDRAAADRGEPGAAVRPAGAGGHPAAVVDHRGPADGARPYRGRRGPGRSAAAASGAAAARPGGPGHGGGGRPVRERRAAERAGAGAHQGAGGARPATAEEVRAVLGAPPHTTPTARCRRGAATRGSAPLRCCGSRCPPPRTRSTTPRARRTGRPFSRCCPSVRSRPTGRGRPSGDGGRSRRPTSGGRPEPEVVGGS